MNNRTADIVGDLEQDNHYLRMENERLKQDAAVAHAEITRLTTENAMLLAKGQDAQTRATKIETIMAQVSAGLVSGLNELKQDRERRRIQQVAVLEEETGPAPKFLQQRRSEGMPEFDTHVQEPPAPSIPRRPPADATDAVARSLGIDNIPRLGGRSVAQIDHTLAGRDGRLPDVDIVERDADTENLLGIADQIGRR